MASWYAVYTKGRWEKRVAERLTQKGIINYCPLNRVVHQWHDRKKTILEPLFKSYVFVQIDLADKLSVIQTPGIVGFVNWLGRPGIIRNLEIELIRQFLQEHKNVSVMNEALRVNDQVKVSGGPLTFQVGRIVELGKKTVKLFIPSLKIVLYAEVERHNVVRISLSN